jgi:hypothetical protein
MNEGKKYEFSESLLKGDEDYADLDPNMNVDDILNEDDDYDSPSLRNNHKTVPSRPERPLIKVKSTNLMREATPNTKNEDHQRKIKNESDLFVRNWNVDDKGTFGDSKMVKIFPKRI